MLTGPAFVCDGGAVHTAVPVSGSSPRCGALLADLDVHPRVAMQILRHADSPLTMEIYTLASSAATRDAL